MNKIMITGAGGFVGQELCRVLEDAGHSTIPVFRSAPMAPGSDTGKSLTDKFIDAHTDWADALADVEVVVHLAARVHVMNRRGFDDLANFREVNVEGTRNLAKQSARFGVKRFVYLSSIKVNGERTDVEPFVADQAPSPEDSYARSKMEAENALREIEKEAGLEVVIIRPPLVYGPGVKGNLAAMIRMIKKGLPLPLGSVSNRRDLVSIYNLCDLIKVCCLHPNAAGSTFLVSDGESISTADLIRFLSMGLGRKSRLLFVPIWALKVFASFVGKMAAVEKLTSDLQIDISQTRKLLDWKPPVTVFDSFQKMFTKERDVDANR